MIAFLFFRVYNCVMVRKIFLLFIPFFFVACASNKSGLSQHIENIPPYEVKIEITGADMVSLTAVYRGSWWAFLNGIEIKNAAGETKKYKLKDVNRSVQKDSSVYEYGFIVLINNKSEYIDIRNAENLIVFIGDGNVTARPLADDKYFDFIPVEIKYR